MESRSTHRWCRPFQGRRVFRKEAGSDPTRSSALSVHPSKERPLKAIPQAGWLLARLDASLRETTRVGSVAACDLRTTRGATIHVDELSPGSLQPSIQRAPQQAQKPFRIVVRADVLGQ